MLNKKNYQKEKTTQKFVLKDKGSITLQRPIHIAQELSWNYGEDVVIYDVRNSSPFVSFYIVATAANDRRLRALEDTAREALYSNYKTIDHTEGNNKSEWILLDAKDVVIQLFTKKERERVGFDVLYQNVPHKIVVAKEEPVYRKKKRPAPVQKY